MDGKEIEMGKTKSKASKMRIPKKNRQLFGQIIELIDAFCDAHLNEDYKDLCEEMAGEICRTLNFLHDPNRSPHMTSAQLAEGFGVSKGTMMTKSRIIRDKLDITTLDLDWCTPAMLADNPLVWMFDVGGFVMDIRDAPRQVQEEAYRQGLIPFIPADKQEPEPESGAGIKIIEFPSRQSETSKPKSPQKSKDNGPSLFEELEKQGISDAE
jgi:hypothetical protein